MHIEIITISLDKKKKKLKRTQLQEKKSNREYPIPDNDLYNWTSCYTGSLSIEFTKTTRPVMDEFSIP